MLSKGCELSHPVEDYAQHLGHTMVELAQGGRRLTFRRAPDANAWHGAFPAEPTPATGAVVAAVAAAAAPAEVDNAVAVSATPTAQAGSSRPAQPVIGYVPVSALARETQDAHQYQPPVLIKDDNLSIFILISIVDKEFP